MFSDSRRRRTLVLLSIYLTVLFAGSYLTDVARPGRNIGSSWYTSWADQHAYYEMVDSIPKGHLGSFQFPPGYPFLGYLGSFLSPADPFLLVDYLLFTGFIVLSWKAFTSFLTEVSAFAGALVLAHISVRLFEIPWTSSVAATAAALLLLMFTQRLSTPPWAVAAGIAIGLTFSARIGDILVIAPVILLIGWSLAGKPRELAKVVLWASLPAAIICGVTILVDYRLSHTLLGPYMQRVQSQGFSVRALPRNLYGYVIDSWTLDRYVDVDKTIWRVVPLLPLAPIGIGLLLLRSGKRALGLALLTPILAWIAAYGAFYAVNGQTLRYGSAHYCKILFPSLIASAFYVVDRVSGTSATPSQPG